MALLDMVWDNSNPPFSTCLYRKRVLMDIFEIKNIGNKLTLIFFTIIGVFLRVYHIGFQCLWTEEQYTLNISKLPTFNIILTSINSDVNPPIFYILSHLSLVLSGYNEIAIRYPSLIAGILAIPAMFYLGKVVKNETTGLVCAGITAVLTPLIYYSQFGRAYALAYLAFIITLILFIKIRKGEQEHQQMILPVLFGIFAGINIWIHLFSIIPISLMLLDLILLKKEIKPILLAGVICIPLIEIPLTTLKNRINEVRFGMTLNEILIITPREFFGSAFPFLTVLAVWGFYKERNNRLTLELVLISIITIITGLIISSYTSFFPRYYLQIGVILTLFAAIAYADLIGHIKSNATKLFLIIIGTSLLLLIMSKEIMVNYTIQKYIC